MSTQNESQDVEMQHSSPTTSSGIWGRLVSLNPKYENIDLKGEQVILGRTPGVCDYAFDNSAVSGKHCRIYYNKPAVGSATCMLEDLSTNGTFINNDLVGKNKSKLLFNGCDIALLPKNKKERIVFMFVNVQEEAIEVEEGGPQQSYDMRDVLGRGTFATVRTGIHKKTGEVFAIKIIDKQKFMLNARRKDALMDEVRVLTSVSHENIIKIQEVFETAKSLYLVLELVTGGELFDRVAKGAIPEPGAKSMFVQMLNSIAYLHGQGIVHRDLKPENILLKSADSDIIKLSDFGLSRIIDEGSFMKTVCGTPQYVAPEILTNGQKEGYGKAVDLWSLGVILYVLLSGCMPFDEDEGGKVSLFDKVKKGLYKFPAKYWKHISEEAKDLIRGLLVVDPAARLTVQQALQHPWLADNKNNSPVNNNAELPTKMEEDTPKKSPEKVQPEEVKNEASPTLATSNTPTTTPTISSKHTPISARRRRKAVESVEEESSSKAGSPSKRKK